MAHRELGAFLRALRLDDAERRHLFTVAGHRTRRFTASSLSS